MNKTNIVGKCSKSQIFKHLKMAAARRFDWARRYSLCFVIFIVIFIIQIFLASKLFPSEYSDPDYLSDGVNSQGKSPVYSEVKKYPLRNRRYYCQYFCAHVNVCLHF